MKNAKKGLRLLSFSIILNIAWQVAYNMLRGNEANLIDVLANFLKYGVLISSIIAIICYVVDLVGLHIAGKDSKYFHRASFLKIASILASVVCLILSIVTLVKPEMYEGVAKANNIVNIVTGVAEIVVLTSVIKGCKEISPRVKGQANFVYVCFIIQVALMISLPFIADNVLLTGNNALAVLLVALSSIFAVVAVLYVIFYVILIFRATAHVGKPR